MEKNDWITQHQITPNFEEVKLEFSISGLLSVLDGKRTPLTPAEQVLHALLEQPTVEARASFNELWEFARENHNMELAVMQVERIREFFPEIQVLGMEDPLYSAGKKRVDEWIQAHDESLQKWFEHVRDGVQELAPQRMTRRNFIQHSANLLGMFLSFPLMVKALDDIKTSGVDVWKVARVITGGAGIGLSMADGNLRNQEIDDTAQGEHALENLNGILHRLDAYIFIQMYKKHPEIFKTPPMQHLSR